MKFAARLSPLLLGLVAAGPLAASHEGGCISDRRFFFAGPTPGACRDGDGAGCVAACESGDREACATLAIRLSFSDRGYQFPDVGRRAMVRACRMGDDRSCWLLPTEFGFAMTGDEPFGELLDIGCEAGGYRSCLALADFFEDRRDREETRRPDDSGDAGDSVEPVVEAARSAARARTVERSRREGIRLARLACSRGEAHACLALVRLPAGALSDGERPALLARGRERARRDCLAGDGIACLHRDEFDRADPPPGDDSPGAPPSADWRDEALDRFLRECRAAPDWNACQNADTLEPGNGERPGEQSALDAWLKREEAAFSRGALLALCARGDAGACRESAWKLGRWPGGGPCEPVERARLLRLACEGSEAHSCVEYGVALWRGRGVAANPESAARLFEAHCAEGGCNALGLLFESGELGFVDLTRAGERYSEGCAAGDYAACDNERNFHSGRERLDRVTGVDESCGLPPATPFSGGDGAAPND